MVGGFKIKTVSVLCWAGHGNFGDELVLEGLKTLFRGWRVEVYSNTPDGVYPAVDFEAVNDSDLFVLGGGELIRRDCLFYYSPLVKYTFVPAFVHRLFLARDWVKKIKVPKIILGCGVNAGAAWELNGLVRRELERFDFVGLRDLVSLDMLSSVPSLRGKVGLSYDLAFALEPIKLNYRLDYKDVAVVVPTNRFYYNKFAESKKWLCQNLRDFDFTFFLPFGLTDNDDYKTSIDLSDCANHWSIVDREDLSFNRIVALMSACREVFAYRLHGLILAFISGAKYRFWPYHHKLSRVNDTLVGESVEMVRVKQRLFFNRVLEGCNLC